jgi:SulP family sulfate permease
MGALALELASGSHGEAGPERALLFMTLVALLAGLLQIGYGLLRGGTLIRYVPYPVVAGYLSGVGVVIFLKQLPSLFGLEAGVALTAGLSAPSSWQWPALLVGGVTIALTLLAPRLTRRIPAPILGLAGGALAYFVIGALAAPQLLSLDGNGLVIGRLPGSTTALAAGMSDRLGGVGTLRWSDLRALLPPALTLSVLLSIDTLKTCVVVDALTRSRHDSNREVIAQGVANLGSALLGGMPGAGTSGPTLINVASGGKTRLSGIVEGGLSLVAFLLLAPIVAWAPLAALSGILTVVAYRMFHWDTFRLLRQRSTLLDFTVIAAVIVVSVGVGLITASAVGIGLAIVLFVREQIRGSVIHRRLEGNQHFSRQKRLPAELAILQREGAQTLVCELEGNLFFGTTDQLQQELTADLRQRNYIILDLRRVRSVDFTAVHMLEQMQTQCAERGAHLLFSNVPKALPAGQDLRQYFDEVGLVTPQHTIPIFDQLSDALEWAEDRILEGEGRRTQVVEAPMALHEIDFLSGRKEETRDALAAIMVERSCAPGDHVFRQGEAGDEIFFIRRGSVKIALQRAEGRVLHVATFARGDFFGDMAFLGSGVRSADAVAQQPTDLFVLSRARFDAVAERHPRLAQQLFSRLARALAIRLRQADAEIRALEDA